MKIMINLALTFAVGLSAPAATRPHVLLGSKHVIVYLKLGPVSLSTAEMAVARWQASRLFANTPFQLEWRSGSPKPDPFGARVIGIEFTDDIPDRFCDRAHQDT